MFDDLLKSKKEEILKEFEIGDSEEMNWDIVPIAIFEVEIDSEEK